MLLVVVFVVVPLLLAVLLEFALSGVEAATGAAATEELTGEETMPYADGTVLAAADPATMNGDAAAGDELVITDTFIVLPPSRMSCCCCCWTVLLPLPLLPASA